MRWSCCVLGLLALCVPWTAGCFLLVQAGAETACEAARCHSPAHASSHAPDGWTSTSESNGACSASSSASTSGTSASTSGTSASSAGSSVLCGAMSQDCGGGACVDGRCQPFVWHQGTRPNFMTVASNGMLYWTSHLDAGSVVGRSLVEAEDALKVVASPEDRPWALAVDEAEIFWTHGMDDYGSGYSPRPLRHASRDGGAPEDFADGASGATVVTARDYVFWIGTEPSTLKARRIGGQTTLTFPLDRGGRVLAAAPGGEAVFLLDNLGSLYRMVVPGDGPPTTLVKLYQGAASSSLVRMVVTRDLVVWGTGSMEILCMPFTGDTPTQPLAGVDGGPGFVRGLIFDLAYDPAEGFLYFTTRTPGFSHPTASVQRMKLDRACHAGPPEVLASAPDIRGVVEHGQHIYWAVHDDGSNPPEGRIMGLRKPPVEASSSSTSSSGSTSCSAANLQTDRHHCGRCDHDCGQGACEWGECQPFAWQVGTRPNVMAISPDGRLFWTSHVLGGSVVHRSLLTADEPLGVVAFPEEYAWAVAADEHYVVWTHGIDNAALDRRSSLRFATRDGGVPQDLAANAWQMSVAMAGRFTFWIDGEASDLKAREMTTGFTTVLPLPYASGCLEASPAGDAVYVVDSTGAVFRAAVPEQGPPTGVDQLVPMGGSSSSTQLAVAATTLFIWTNNVHPGLQCLPLTGGDPRQLLPITSPDCSPCILRGLAYDEDHGQLYFTVHGQPNTVRVMSVDFACQAGTPRILATGESIRGITHHGNFIYWALHDDGSEPPRGAIMALRKPAP